MFFLSFYLILACKTIPKFSIQNNQFKLFIVRWIFNIFDSTKPSLLRKVYQAHLYNFKAQLNQMLLWPMNSSSLFQSIYRRIFCDMLKHSFLLHLINHAYWRSVHMVRSARTSYLLPLILSWIGAMHYF